MGESRFFHSGFRLMTSPNTGAAVCHRPPLSAGAALTHSEPHNEAKIVWPDLVKRVRAGETAAMEDLYRLFSGGIRFYLWRQLGAQDISDRLHDIFLVVPECIRAGGLRD